MTGKLYVVMVGLPAMGKSTTADKIRQTLAAQGISAAVFNNGDVRRELLGPATAAASFYDPANTEGVALREKIARINLARAQDYLAGSGAVAVLDATNVSAKRRALITASLTDHPILFVACVNDDPELLAASIGRKATLPEFSRLDQAEAVASFEKRIAYYRRIYEPLSIERDFVELDTLNNRILREKTDGRLPYYRQLRDLLVSDWVRNLYLVRHGETWFNLENRIGGDSDLTPTGQAQARALAEHFRSLPPPFVFTSTRRRTRQMAAPLAALRPETQVIALPEFDEIDAGECEGMRYEEIARDRPEVWAARGRDKYNYVYPSGEGYVTLKDRVERGVKKALYLSGNSERFMIVGHQAVNRMILSHFLYRRTEDVPHIYIPQNRLFHIVSTQYRKVFELLRFREASAADLA